MKKKLPSGGAAIHQQSRAPSNNQFTEIIGKLIYELNVARLNIGSYPKGHPAITASAFRVLQVFRQASETKSKITLAVAKDTFLYDEQELTLKIPAVRSLARSLFDQGIAVITLEKGLTDQEVICLSEALSLKSEDLREQGGFPGYLKKTGVQHIRVQAVDYSVITVNDISLPAPQKTKPDAVGSRIFWEKFVRQLMHGSIPGVTTDNVALSSLEPEIIAGMLNTGVPTDNAVYTERYGHSLSTYFGHLCTSGTLADSESMEKMCRLVGNLNPELVRHFLSGSMPLLSERTDLAERLLASVPGEIIARVLQEKAKQKDYIPPVILQTMRKLAKAADSSQWPESSSFRNAQDAPDVFEDKIQTLLKEEELDKYMPKDYQEFVCSFHEKDIFITSESGAIGEMKKTLETHWIEKQTALLCIELFGKGTPEAPSDDMRNNIVELCRYLLQTGEFETLASVIKSVPITRDTASPGQSHDGHSGFHAVFGKTEFLEEVINAPVLWGKTQYPGIAEIIRLGGSIFTEQILYGLANARDLSLRRFFFDRLSELGPKAKDAVIGAIGDVRWFYVRNLLIILRNMNDQEVPENLDIIRNHSHPKVRQELIRTYLHYGSAAGNRMLAEDMENPDMEVKMNAVTVSGKSGSPAIVRKLIEFLELPGFDTDTLTLKKAAVYALSEIGDPEAVPALRRILGSISIFNAKKLRDLKNAVILSLEGYEDEHVAKLKKKYGTGVKITQEMVP